MPRQLRVLHLEDSPRDAEMILDRLEREGIVCDVVLATDKGQFEAALQREPFDLVISDYNLPGYDGITALKHAQLVQPDTPVILISGTVGEEQAVRVLQSGATDYLLKGSLDRLAPAVRRAIREAETNRTRHQAQQALEEREQALRESEERTNFALGAARTGIWEVDFVNGRQTWSDAMAPLFGLPAGATPKTQEQFIEAIHPDDRATLTDSIRGSLAGERHPGVEFRVMWPDGSAHWIHGRAQARFDDNGKPIRLIGVAMDIDERKLLEEQLRQSQKLEAIGQLAGGIAHDFNNVLTVILGFSELRLMSLEEGDPARDDLLEIKKAGSRAAGLTRQLLAFSRKQILQPEVLDLNALIGGIEPMLRLLIAESIDLSVALRAQDPLVRMDPTQVEQILVNLAVNAADAMPRGGKLLIETRNVVLDEHYKQRHLPVRPGDYVLLAVTDTGVGMDDATSRRIFEPFFTTKAVGKGTGLGLATVYGIVKQSDGDIWVYSKENEGTTFNIYLPLVADDMEIGSSERDGADETDDTARCVETILLVEDDEGVRLLARRALEGVGYNVLQAGNPREGEETAVAFDGTIHLLLSDVVMPESHGAPLFERLTPRRPSMRVLYMSGYADEAIRHVLLVDGAPFLQKPFTPEALARKVRDVLDGPVPARDTAAVGV